MRRLGFFSALAFTTLAGPAMFAPPSHAAIVEGERASAPERKQQRRAQVAQALRKYHSRRPQAKPAKRPNMRHVSKRVRRKHRRS